MSLVNFLIKTNALAVPAQSQYGQYHR